MFKNKLLVVPGKYVSFLVLLIRFGVAYMYKLNILHMHALHTSFKALHLYTVHILINHCVVIDEYCLIRFHV